MISDIESLINGDTRGIRDTLTDMMWVEREAGENLSSINIPAALSRTDDLTYDEKRLVLEMVKGRLAKIFNYIRADLLVDGQPGDSVPDNMTASERVLFNEVTQYSLDYLARVRQLMMILVQQMEVRQHETLSYLPDMRQKIHV